MAFPMTLQAFYEAFPDEASCWRWLRRTRWPRGFHCPRCGSRESSWLSRRNLVDFPGIMDTWERRMDFPRNHGHLGA